MPAESALLVRAAAGPSVGGSALRYPDIPLSALADGSLIERAVGARGSMPNPDAFGILYQRYVGQVFAFVYSRVCNRTEAEDITSQTFLQALGALPRYEERGVPFRHWLYSIAANLIASLHRRCAPAPLRSPRGESRVHGTAWPDSAAEPPDARAAALFTSWEVAEDTRPLLQALSPEQRTAVRLRFIEDLPIAEIAARTARSEGAVRTLLFRARQHLRRQWLDGDTLE